MTDLGPNMRRVQVTTLVLQAEDDPIVSEKHVDWNKLSANKNIITMHTNRGGHVAWYVRQRELLVCVARFDLYTLRVFGREPHIMHALFVSGASYIHTYISQV